MPQYELTSKLEAWLDRSILQISQNLEPLLIAVSLPKWYKDSDGDFKKTPNTFFFNNIELSKIIFSNSKEWIALKEIANKDENFLSHIDNLVTTNLGERRTFSLEELCLKLLPKPSTDGNKFFLDEQFEKRKKIVEFVDVITTSEIKAVTIWPIGGVTTKDSLVLDNQTIFRELTDAEKIACLSFGIIAPLQENLVKTEHAKWYGLIRSELILKTFESTHNISTNYISQKVLEREEVLEDFLSIISLLENQVAYHAGGFHSAPSFEVGNILSDMVGFTSNSSYRFLFTQDVEYLSEESILSLRELWKIVRSNKGDKKQGRLVNAMKRLFYAETRTKTEDKLIDCMIAAESLYLDDDKNELSYRLAINGAMWSDSVEIPKEEIFKILKKAYTFRSKIVHGSFVNNEQLNNIHHQARKIIKLGVVKAFNHLHNGTFPPEWTIMILK